MEIEQHELDPFAQVMLAAYLAAADDAHAFMEEYGMPPTAMDKAHRFRSVVQALVAQSARYSLHPEYMELGRVQITDSVLAKSCLIRSKSAISIEDAMARGQMELFPAPIPDLPFLLAYDFDRSGMKLWTCPTKRAPASKRLIPLQDLDFAGFWTFDSAAPRAGRERIEFDQGLSDPFDDLGNPDIDEAGGL